MPRVAIVQSNYIPWKGYFDIISKVDRFILYDDVQYTKQDWRNRNQIKTPQGLQWLTIPVQKKKCLENKIQEISISDSGWRKKHWKSIKQNYGRAPFFGEYAAVFETLYLQNLEDNLSRINFQFIEVINGLLGIKTEILFSREFSLPSGKTERLVELCRQSEADEYVTGPAALRYLDQALFHRAGIALSRIDYSGYPEYPQLYPPFVHQVTVLDLIFNTGPDALRYLKRKDGSTGIVPLPDRQPFGTNS